MRQTIVLALLAASGAGAVRALPAQEATTVLHGTVRTAVTRTPVGGVTIDVGLGALTTTTDSAGRFSLRVPRGASTLELRKSGYLDFQYPILRLTTDSLRADVELRTDPPGAESYVARGGFLPLLCIIIDAPDRLDVFNGCRPLPSDTVYTRRIIKHNPWSLYFGRAGDRGGVVIASKVWPL